MVLRKYAKVLPHLWFAGNLIGMRDGRIRFVMRFKHAFNPENLTAQELHSKALLISRYLNNNLPIGEHLQLLALAVPDVDEILQQHLELVTTERPFLREIAKERLRLYEKMANQGQAVSLNLYLIGGYDPYEKHRQQGLIEAPDPLYVLRRQALRTPETEDLPDESEIVSTALERLSRIKSVYESAGAELEVLDAAANRKLLQLAQFPDFTGSSEDAAIGSYTFHDDYIVQTIEGQRTFYACLIPKGSPERTYSGMFVPLIASGDFVRISLSAYRPSNESNGLFLNIKKSLNDLSNGVQEMLGKRETAASSVQTQEIRQLETMMFKQQIHILHMAAIVVLKADSLRELNYRVKAVTDLMEKSGFSLEVGLRCQEDLWFASLPGHPTAPPQLLRTRCYPIHAAHLLMPTLPWQGSAQPYFLMANRWGQVIPYDPLGLEVSNTILTGKTRSGKSVQAADQLLQAAAVGWRSATIDKFGSYHFIVEHVIGGVARRMEPGAFTLNPFEFYIAQGVDLSTIEIPSSRVEVLKVFFATVLAPEGDQLPTLMRSILTVSIDLTYRRILPQGHFPTIDDLYASLNLLLRGEQASTPAISNGQATYRELMDHGSEAFRSTVDELLAALLEFRSPSAMETKIFNGQSSQKFFNSDHIYFDVSPLGDGTRAQVLVSQLLAASIDEWVMSSLATPTFLIFDEIYKYLTSNPQMMDLITRASRTYQRYGVTLVLVTQSFSDILKSKYSADLFEQTSIRWALQQDKFEEAASSLGARSTEIAMVNDLKKERGYFAEMVLFYGDETTILINYASPMRYWVTSTGPYDRPLREFFINELKMSPQEAIVKLATLVPHGVHDKQTYERIRSDQVVSAV